MKAARLAGTAFATWLAVCAHPVDGTTRISQALLDDARKTMLVDPMRAAAIARNAQASASEIANSTQRALVVAAAERIIAECSLRSNDFHAAKQQIDHAINALTHLNDPKLMAEALLTRGGVHASSGMVGAALRDYQNAFRGSQQVNDERNQALALSMIAILYADAKDNLSALKYLTQAAELAKDDSRLGVVIMNNRGNSLFELGRLSESDGVLVGAEHLAEKLKSPMLIIQVLGNIARNQLHSGNIDAADVTIAKAFLLAKGDAAAWRPQLKALAAEAALQRHRLPLAGQLIEQSFADVDLKTTTIMHWTAHNTAYRTFMALHRPADALAHLVALKRLDDEATKLATSTSTALMGARFDFANQELRIARLRAEEYRRSVVAEQEKARIARLIFLIVSGATAAIIALLAWLLFTIRRSRDSIKAANEGLAITNAALGKALAAKTEFLATTSHEIRTPLNGILGMTQVMLADRALAPDVRDRLGVVHAAGTTMRTLVDDILDMAKMETGNLSVEHAPFDLCATLQGATLLWEAQCRAKGLAFHARLGDCPALIRGDAARVRQIVFNLLANAVKFTAEGGVDLSVSVDRDTGRVSIAVADTGIGIDPAQQAAIFEAFRQADASTTRRFGGTGLGLSISRNLAEAMGGDIRVDSVAGEGATFTLTLPLIEEGVDARSPSPADGPACDLLVLDRNPISRAMMRSLLAPHVGEIAFVGDADEAIEAIRAGRPARMLIDDATIGADVVIVGRVASAARAAEIRTVLLWPAGRDGEHAALHAAGIDRIVARPFTGAALIDAVAAATRALVSEAA